LLSNVEGLDYQDTSRVGKFQRWLADGNTNISLIEITVAKTHKTVSY
jgi:hypothetical protein